MRVCQRMLLVKRDLELKATAGEEPGNSQFNYVALLKACTRKKDLCKGTRVHAQIIEKGLLQDSPYLASTLIDMYAKCGVFSKAEEILKGLQARDVVSWSALIAGYAQHGQGHKALRCFEQMQKDGLYPNAITLTSILKACGNVGAIDKGEKIHNEVLRKGWLKKDILLSTALIDMYAKCGVLSKAQQVFEGLPVRNVVSWNALISGSVQQGKCIEALNFFEHMRNEGICPDEVSFTCILKACGSIGALEKGTRIHQEIMTRNLLKKDIILSTALVDMYIKCGAIVKANELLELLPAEDVIMWNAVIAAYAQQGLFHEALKSFECMQSKGLSPNSVTLICILMVCGCIGDIDKGMIIHEMIIDKGLIETDIMLGTALVDMYGKCGVLAKAKEVLETLPVRNVVSWNALIASYAQQGDCHESMNCLEKMQSEGLYPDEVTFICILKACGNAKAIEKGKQIHGVIESSGLLEKDGVLGNALVDMYAKCGELIKALNVLKQLPVQQVISWNAVIAGYAHNGQFHEALECFKWIQTQGLSPDQVTFILALKACSCIGAVDEGKLIHCEVAAQGLLEKNVMLGNAIIDMYAKCGVFEKAEQVFEELPLRDLVSWSTLIAGYAQHGRGHEALICFEWMQNEGLFPNSVTLLSVLTACSHSGLLNEAQILFADMSRKYQVSPNIEHLTCMVAGFGFAGEFNKAVPVIMVMPSSLCTEGWLVLLAACRKWRNVDLGMLAFDQIVQVDGSCATAYALMADVFEAVGMQEDALNVEVMRLKYAALIQNSSF